MARKSFIEEISVLIQKYIKIYGYPFASPIIAQACLESGYGTSELAVNANNFFGIKYSTAKRVPSSKGYYVKVGSEQNADGSYVSSVMKWCKFDSMEDCVKGYFEFLNNGYGRYANLKTAKSPEEYLKLIRTDGYATSLQYIYNVKKTMNDNHLTKYDGVITPTVYYVVNCGSYTNLANAEDLLRRLQEKGITASIKKIGNLWKVRVGRHNHISKAEELATEIKKKGFDCFVTTDN
jgi:flagellum-specific peptidoglycan hydrolase FlgJ